MPDIEQRIVIKKSIVKYLIQTALKFMTIGRSKMVLTEVAKDEEGNILWEEPYTLSRLFKAGQSQIVNSIKYIVVSCELIEDTVYTVLRRGRPC